MRIDVVDLEYRMDRLVCYFSRKACVYMCVCVYVTYHSIVNLDIWKNVFPIYLLSSTHPFHLSILVKRQGSFHESES